MKKKKILVTVAPVSRVANPDDEVVNPLTPQQVAEETLACEKEGASQVHLHVRNEDGSVTHKTDVYSKTLDLIREKSNIIIQGSTGSFEKELTLDERCSAIDDPKTQVASLNMGSINFGEDIIFKNPEIHIEYWAKRFAEANVVPELEIFDRGMLCTVERFLSKNVLKGPLSVNFPLGYHTGMQPTVADIMCMRDRMPADSWFGITHNAMSDFSIIAASIAMGAIKVRVGFEDSIYYAPNKKAKNNVVLVKKVVEMIHSIGFDVMSVDEAKEMYGIE